MDIKSATIDQTVLVPNGRQAKIVGIFQDGTIAVDFGAGDYHWVAFYADRLEPIAPELLVGDTVRATGKSSEFKDDVNGMVGKIDKFMVSTGKPCANVFWPSGNSNVVPLSQLTKIGACESREMAATITSQRKQIADLERSRVELEAIANRHARNEDYYREELAKLKQETLAEHIHPAIHIEDFRKKPLGEVAKIYVGIKPEKLLMSPEARRVVEYVTAVKYAYLGRILEDLKDVMPASEIMDGIIEARDAGIIQLSEEGKYSIMEEYANGKQSRN